MRTQVISQARKMDQSEGQPVWQHIVLLVVLGYEGFGALVGGSLLVIAPDGRLMNMSVEIMHDTFPNFLVPGIVLFGLGVLSTLAFLAVLRNKYTDWIMAGLALEGFVIWFIVEIIILRELHWLHLMWGLPVLIGWLVLIPLIALRNPTQAMQRSLLVCGIISSLWYFIINIFVPMHYQGYYVATYTVSELSAIGSPTRLLWVLLVLLYPLLFAAFGWGVMQSAGNHRLLRFVGGLIVVYCFFNLYWPPMHMRGAPPTWTDTLHIAWAIITNIFMWLFMTFGAVALGRKFRIYTGASIMLHIVFGILTFLEAPNIATNAPTPTIGIWERINISIFMLWVVVFAIVLLKKDDSTYGQTL